MASSANAARLTGWPAAVLSVVLTLNASPLCAQRRLTLAELGNRNSADSSPTYLGQRVLIRGIVSAPAFHFPEYAMVALQDDSRGAILKLALPQNFLDSLRPGDDVEAQGIVGMQFGMTVVQPDSVVIQGRKPAPKPVSVSVKDLLGFTNLGRLVRIEGKVLDDGYNAGGAVVSLGGAKEPYK